MSLMNTMSLIRLDIREVITDILTIRVSVGCLPDKEREQIWEFILQEISGLEKYVTKEQLTVVRDIFHNIKNEIVYPKYKKIG